MFENMARLVLARQSAQPVHATNALKMGAAGGGDQAKSGCC